MTTPEALLQRQAEYLVQTQHQRHLSFKVKEVLYGERAKFPTGAFALLFRKNTQSELEVLLVYRGDYQIWNLPGGGLDPFESLWEGTVREVREETGLEVKPLSTIVMTYSQPLDKENPIGSEGRTDVYGAVICSIQSGTLTLTDESEAIAWFPVHQLPPNLFERHKWAIQATTNDKQLETVIQETLTT